MFRVPTALHLRVAHIDDIARPIAICSDTYKFVACPCSVLQEFRVDNKMMVMNHSEPVRKLHTGRTDFDRNQRSVFIAYELDISWDPDVERGSEECRIDLVIRQQTLEGTFK